MEAEQLARSFFRRACVTRERTRRVGDGISRPHDLRDEPDSREENGRAFPGVRNREKIPDEFHAKAQRRKGRKALAGIFASLRLCVNLLRDFLPSL